MSVAAVTKQRVTYRDNRHALRHNCNKNFHHFAHSNFRLIRSLDSSSWYREAFSRVDAVMVISSPHHMENGKDKAYYNVNPAALSILEEKSKDAACTLKLLSVILPYCNDKDIPKEAQDLPKFRLPQDLNSILWFIRFGFRTSCFSELEFYLFQSQINGGACDYSRYGKFLRDAVVDANEESRRLWAMLSEAQRV